jgi:hypothetical protein
MWVGIPEAEGEADVESCNISAAGMLLYTSRDAGEPGAVRMLRLVTGDLAASIEIMAHVVRVETRLDPDGSRVREATAFEFLSHHPKELEEFLRIALEGKFSVPVPDQRRAASAVDSEQEPQADPVGPLQVSRIALYTNRALKVGTEVWLEFETPAGESLRLSGSCMESLPLDGAGNEDLYRVEVNLDSLDSSHAATASDTADPSTGRQRKGVHLSGSLSEVAIMSLLGFLELERSSGVLSLQHESKKASIFVSEGNVLDVVAEPAGESAIDSFTSLLSWPDGTFEFSFQSVDRANAIGMSTTALLMECARLQDEDSHSQ